MSAVPTSLGHHGLASMVHVHAAISALSSLLDDAIAEGAAVITPSGLVVGGGLELVGAWLLNKEGRGSD